jgi:hypothetical protein
VAVSFCPKKKHGMNSIKNNGGNTMTEAVHAMLWTMAAAFLKERIRIEKVVIKLLTSLHDDAILYLQVVIIKLTTSRRTHKMRIAVAAANSKGESIISYADYAIAIVDEIENAAHVKERISVLGE